MKTRDIVLFAYSSLEHRKLRAFLTIIGIVIGVASIVSLVSIGQGVQEQVNSRLSGLGSDIITISLGNIRASGSMGGFGGFIGFSSFRTANGRNLTEEDVRVVRNTPGVAYASGMVSERGEISYSGEDTDVSVTGVDESSWRFIVSTQLESGRYLQPGDSYSVVIGHRIANGIFSDEVSAGDQITVEGKAFKVVGVLQEGGFGAGQDMGVYVPKSTSRQVFGLDSRKVDSISVKVSDASEIANVTDEIKKRLRVYRRLKEGEEDFSVSNSLAMQSQISSVSSTMTLFLAAIAGISLLVGAIGISNTMFTSVMERTRQIGIMKSLGSTDTEVMKIFVVESSLIGMIGGIVGALLGIAASQTISMMGSFATSVTPGLVAASILFAVIVGALSGYFPAKRAAKLQPVEALRYE